MFTLGMIIDLVRDHRNRQLAAVGRFSARVEMAVDVYVRLREDLEFHAAIVNPRPAPPRGVSVDPNDRPVADIEGVLAYVVAELPAGTVRILSDDNAAGLPSTNP